MGLQTDRVRIGLIGAGNLGRTRAKCLAGIPEAELVAVASRTKEKAHRLAEEHGLRTVFDNHRELLASEVDAVIVATPNDTHYEIVRDALRAGKDVLVEYPLVNHSEHAVEIIRLAEEKKAVIEVGFDTRFDPQYVFSVYSSFFLQEGTGRSFKKNGACLRTRQFGRSVRAAGNETQRLRSCASAWASWSSGWRKWNAPAIGRRHRFGGRRSSARRTRTSDAPAGSRGTLGRIARGRRWWTSRCKCRWNAAPIAGVR